MSYNVGRLPNGFYKNCYELAFNHFQYNEEFDGKKCLVVEGKDDCSVFDKIFSDNNPNISILSVDDLGIADSKYLKKCKFNINLSQAFESREPKNCDVKMLIDKDFHYDYVTYKAKVSNNHLLIMDYRDLESTIMSTNNNGCYGLGVVKSDKTAIKKFVYALVNAVAFSLVGDIAMSVCYQRQCLRLSYSNAKYMADYISLYGIQGVFCRTECHINDILSILFCGHISIGEELRNAIIKALKKFINGEDAANLNILFNINVAKGTLTVNKSYVDDELLHNEDLIKPLLHYARGHTLMAALRYGDIDNYLHSPSFEMDEFIKSFKDKTNVGIELKHHFGSF